MTTRSSFSPTRLGPDFFIWEKSIHSMPIAVTSLGEEGKQRFMRLLGKVEDRIWLSMPYGSDARGLSKEQKLIEKLDAMSLGIKDPIILIALVATTIYTILIVRRLTDAKL